MNKFLVLGTGSDINNIEFDRVHKDFITAGVNRIYERIIPDIYYCYDAVDVIPNVPDDIETIYTHPAKLQQFFNQKYSDKHNYFAYHDPTFTLNYTFEGKEYNCGHGAVNYLLRLLNGYLYRGQDNIFYIAGVPLLEGIGHFHEEPETNTTVQVALDRFYNDFLRLKRFGYNIVSVMKESKLNDIFPVDDINVIYGGNK